MPLRFITYRAGERPAWRVQHITTGRYSGLRMFVLGRLYLVTY